MKNLPHHTADFLARVEHIESRGVSRSQAWEIATGTFPRMHYQVVLENSLPDGAQLSPDGRVLVQDWPVNAEVLKKLGLPVAGTSKEEYQLYRRAESTPLTPEIAAVVVRELIQFSQITHATTFNEALDFLKKNKPELHKLATKPQ